MHIIIQMDDPAGFIPTRDSTIALALEAQARGYQVSYFLPDSLTQQGEDLVASVRPITFFDREDDFFTQGEAKTVNLETADIILIRQEPPYDTQYLTTCWLLERLQKPLILNNPTALRHRPEKLFPLALPQHSPATLISRDIQALKAFYHEQKEVIVKPLYSFGGQGIFHIPQKDYNLSSLLEMMLSTSRDPVIMQEFLPDVREKEIRALLIDGEVAGVLNRIPLPTEIRVNSAVGGTNITSTLTDAQKEVCADVGAICRKEGFFFVGLDLIGDKLIEVNTTCPTGITGYRQLTGENIACIFWEKALLLWKEKTA